jgi:DNA topoisomerase-1
MSKNIDTIDILHRDNKACAELAGLQYVEGDAPGISRHKHGKGFTYLDTSGLTVTDNTTKKRINQLIIPPAWQEVWICPDENGHIQATGIDEKGRKQYLYHAKWRELRDLIKFYRLILFGRALPTIRRTINKDLQLAGLPRKKVLGVMLWLLDNTYLRVGNNIYLSQNDSRGLTTLIDKNLVVVGPVITLSFQGKSGKPQQITFDDATIAQIIKSLIARGDERLFSYEESGEIVHVEPEHLNAYLHEITGQDISAKDFRTWGGTLMAFNHLVETEKLPDEDTPKPEKSVVAAVDAAANVLGNTRAVAKSSYVHPDILTSYMDRHFTKLYRPVHGQRTKGLDARESELLAFLEQLFDDEFDLLQKQK